MNIEPIIFFDLTGVLFILSISLLFLVVHYSRIFQKLHSQINEQKQIQTKLDNERAEKIRLAQQQAEQIIEEAGQKAAEIIRKADIAVVDSQSIIKNEIENTASHQTTLFKQELTSLLHSYMQEMENIKKQNLEACKNIISSIEKNASETVTDYQVLLQKETIVSQKIAEEKINSAMARAEQDVEAYKKEKFEKIDQEVLGRVLDVSKKVLGKAFSEEDHQTLVLQALKDAKDAGLLKVGTT